MKTTRRSLSWNVSAVLYRFSYIRLAHELDADLFAYLGERTDGMLVADCGCGPGVVVEKFVARQAARVLAIDAHPSMLRQVQERLPEAVRSGQVIPILGRFDPSLFPRLCDRWAGSAGFDLILFKRSLYAPEDQALAILHAAANSLRPGGNIVIIHPERSFVKYAFGPGVKIRSHTPYHLVNRLASLIGARLGVGEYRLPTQAEWRHLLHRAAPSLHVEAITSRQQAYLLLAARTSS